MKYSAKTNPKSFTLRTGGLAPPIADQVREQGLEPVKPDSLIHFQKIADAITLLSCTAHISDAAAASSRRRLAKSIAANLKEKT